MHEQIVHLLVCQLVFLLTLIHKKMKKNAFYIIITLLFLSNCLSSFPQNQDSTSINPLIELNFEKNIEENTRLWFLENMSTTTENYIPADTVFRELSDSILMHRIKNISSAIDLSYNQIVKNYINVYTERQRENVEIMLGLSNYYFPLFEEILDQYELPSELKYLPIIESALNPKATSRVGAAGLWQFMYGTARMYKLEINSFVDERRDPIKSSHAAARYLKDLHKIYNDWILVIAAYNCGPGNVNKAIRRSGGKRDYWSLYYFLPRETRGYVPAFIAAAYFMNHYQDHLLQPLKIDIPLHTDTLVVNKEIHFNQIANTIGIPLQLLRDLNPQYKYDIVPAKSKSYNIILPFDYVNEFISLQDSIFNYKRNEYFDPSKLLVKPDSKYQYYAPQPSNTEKLYYTVKSGDNLGFIAQWYNVGLSQIRAWNGIRRNLNKDGQKLICNEPKNKVQAYKKINELSFSEKQILIGKPGPTVVEKSNPEKNQNGKYVYHKVRKGDTLWDIAKLYPGTSVSEIRKLNNLKINENIRPGQQLKIKIKS